MKNIYFILFEKKDKETYKKVKKYFKKHRIKFDNSRWFKVDLGTLKYTTFACNTYHYTKILEIVAEDGGKEICQF